jgi:hypothetical protein
MKDGLIIAQSIGCNRIILESECLEVINITWEATLSAFQQRLLTIATI